MQFVEWFQRIEGTQHLMKYFEILYNFDIFNALPFDKWMHNAIKNIRVFDNKIE